MMVHCLTQRSWVFSPGFLSTLNGCCDASEINILVKINKKINFFYPWQFVRCTVLYKFVPINDKCIWFGKKNVPSIPLLLCSYHRSSEQSIIPNLLSVEQKRSPHILPESKAFKSLSPHISPKYKGRNFVAISPHKVYSPTSARGRSPRGSQWQVHNVLMPSWPIRACIIRPKLVLKMF